MTLFLFRVKYILFQTTENPICINELTSAQRSVTADIGTRNKWANNSATLLFPVVTW